MLTSEQIQTITEMMIAKGDVQGILLAGSYAWGEPTDQSDLDLQVVTEIRDSRVTPVLTERFGTKLEIYYSPPWRVQAILKLAPTYNSPDYVHYWVNGKIMYDPSGVVAQLQDFARDIWNTGPVRGYPWFTRYGNITPLRSEGKREASQFI